MDERGSSRSNGEISRDSDERASETGSSGEISTERGSGVQTPGACKQRDSHRPGYRYDKVLGTFDWCQICAAEPGQESDRVQVLEQEATS